jgi:hypothetical protein
MQLAKAYRSLPRPSTAPKPSHPLDGLQNSIIEQSSIIEFSWVFSISGLNFSRELETYTSNLSIRSFTGTLVPILQVFTLKDLEASVSF